MGYLWAKELFQVIVPLSLEGGASWDVLKMETQFGIQKKCPSPLNYWDGKLTFSVTVQEV